MKIEMSVTKQRGAVFFLEHLNGEPINSEQHGAETRSQIRVEGGIFGKLTELGSNGFWEAVRFKRGYKCM